MKVHRFVLALGTVAICTTLLTSAAEDQSTDSLRLPKPDYVDAVERWRDGKPAEALDRLDKVVGEGVGTAEQPVPALLLRATLLEESGRWADAEPLWRVVMTREPALAAFAAREIVVNLCARRLPIEALSMASRPPLADRDEVPADLALLIGHAYRAAKDEAGAIGQYQRVLSARSTGTTADTARLSMASALEATGDGAGALRVLRDAQLLHTDGRTYLRARAEAARLTAGSPTAALWSLEDYAALTRKLRNGSRFAEAATLYLEWRTLPGANLEAIDAALVETLFAGRADAESMSRAAAFLEAYPASPSRARVQLLQFRLDVREGRVDDAQRRGQAFVDDAVPGATGADRRTAASLLAGYLVAVGRVQRGLDAYRALYALTPAGGDRSLISWREGVAAIRAGDLVRAQASLRRALALKPVGDTTPAAQYWLAAIDAQQGRTAAAAATWRQLTAAYPLDYYGARSTERLAALPAPSKVEGPAPIRPPPVRPPSPKAPPVGPVLLPAAVGRIPVGPASLSSSVGPVSLPGVQPPRAKSKRPATRKRANATAPPAQRRFAMPTLDVTTANADYTAARLLARAGLAGPAADYARRVLTGHRNSRGVALLAARASADGGHPHRAMSIAVSYFGSDVARPTPGAPADLASLAYPRAYWEDVRKAADAHRVEPWLLLALARQESLFDTNARSEAGAIGMFQLMPATVALVAGDAGVTASGRVEEDALLQPAVSARLAARLLRTLLDRYDNALPAVIAAYNAGHERVDLWWQSGRTLSEDLFIDTIPYSETRRYVRAVLRNLKRYREIYAKN